MTTNIPRNAFRVLVVENDPKQRDNLVDLLRGWKYDVYFAVATGDAEDALLEDARQKARNHRCHLAIVDMRLRDDNDKTDTSGLALVPELAPTVSIIRSGHGDRKTVSEALDPEDDGRKDVPLRAYKFIGKEDGPDALKKAIEGVDKKVWRRRDVECSCAPALTMHALAVRLSSLGNPIATDEVADMLYRLFPQAERLKIEEINEVQLKRHSVPRGHSLVIKITQDDHVATSTVKLTNTEWRAGSLGTGSNELSRFEAVRPYFPGNRYASVEGEPVRLWNLTGVVYRFLTGDSRFPIYTFTDYYAKNQFIDVGVVIKNYFDFWELLYNVREGRSKSIFSAYDDVRSKKLSRRLLEFKDYPFVYPDYLSSLGLSNPVTWLMEKIGLQENGHYDDGLPDTQIAVCHGDLHGENFFADTRHDVWLIDYEYTGPGPILQDFVELENDILTSLLNVTPKEESLFLRLVCEILKPKELVLAKGQSDQAEDAADSERGKPQKLVLSEGQSDLLAHQHVDKALRTVNALRNLAISLIDTYESDRRQYFYGLLFNAIFRLTLLMREPGKAAFASSTKMAQDTRCLVLAGILCHRLDNWDNSWPPEEWKSLLGYPKQVSDGKTKTKQLSITRQIKFGLQISNTQNEPIMLVRAFDTPSGESDDNSILPYSESDLVVVLKALELDYLGNFELTRFTTEQIMVLEKHDLLADEALVADHRKRIGVKLYEALLSGRGGRSFAVASEEARKARNATVAMQLRLAENEVLLSRYPWELLHDGRQHLLANGRIELTRYVAFDEGQNLRRKVPPYSMLYIEAHPQNDSLWQTLPAGVERDAVKHVLQPLIAAGMLEFSSLNPPTFQEFQNQRDLINQVDIIHFDGHGAFGKCCTNRACNALVYPHYEECPKCHASLRHVEASGFLVFEDHNGLGDPVATKDLVGDLSRSSLGLFLLSACQSATSRGDSVFGGIAPGLILAGVPAVVGMQSSISVNHAVEFAKEFYSSLVGHQYLTGKSISDAVFRGRRKLSRHGAWYIPTLYLRERT